MGLGKKTQKGSSLLAKDHGSCLWGFDSIFEFSQRYNFCKLLADRKRGSARYHSTSFSVTNLSENTWESRYKVAANDIDRRENAVVLARLPSVKALMEEEMSQERNSYASSRNINSNGKKTKNQKNDSDPRFNSLLNSVREVLEQFKSREPVEGSKLIFDLAALLIEFYSVSRYCSYKCEEIEDDLSGSLRFDGHKKHKNLNDESDSRHTYRHSMPQEALAVEVEAFLSWKIDDAKQLARNGIIHALELKDALEKLNSNKALFLKLIQDPNSLLFSRPQELLESQIAEFSEREPLNSFKLCDHTQEKHGNSDHNRKFSSNQAFQKQIQNFFSKKKDECQAKMPLKNRSSSDETSRIVLLKPRLLRKHRNDSKRTASHFSFKEILRKFKLIVGETRKEQRLIDKDSLSRISNSCNDLADTYRITQIESTRTNVTDLTDCKTEDTFQSFSIISNPDANTKAKLCQERIFSGIASTEYGSSNLTSNHIPNSTEKMISQSDYSLLSPRYSSHRAVKLKNYSFQLGAAPNPQLIENTFNFSPDKNSKETPILDNGLNAEMLVINIEKAVPPVETCHGEQTNMEGTDGFLDIGNVQSVHTNTAEKDNSVYVPVESLDGENNSPCEDCNYSCYTSSDYGTPNEKQRILIPTASASPSSLFINHFEPSKFIIEKPDGPSPVSVLEPAFLEDDASPDHPSIKLDQSHNPLEPVHLHFHEDSSVAITTSDCLMPHQLICSYGQEIMTNHVRNLLENYSFDSNLSPESWPSSEALLEPSLLDEIRALRSSCIEDRKLLLDCVNEILLEIKNRRFLIFPWGSFLKPTAQPVLKHVIIHEVCKIIASYLSPQFESTLNEIMRKDMDSALWMNHRLQMECIIADMSCSLLEELLKETVFELFLYTCN